MLFDFVKNGTRDVMKCFIEGLDFTLYVSYSGRGCGNISICEQGECMA